MSAEQQLLICDTTRPNVRVVRFVQPDLKEHLYTEPISQCAVFQALQESALANLSAADTVVLNFGIVDSFPSAFYRLLLQVKEDVKAAKAHLLICCLPPNPKEGFDLMGGERTFAGLIHGSEATAIYAATHASN